jgi:hypothetical protein
MVDDAKGLMSVKELSALKKAKFGRILDTIVHDRFCYFM